MGVAILKTVLAPAADFDLTDLATVKDELNIPSTDTSNDTWLARAISQVSAIISRYCNRVFLPELLLETQSSNRTLSQSDPRWHRTAAAQSLAHPQSGIRNSSHGYQYDTGAHPGYRFRGRLR